MKTTKSIIEIITKAYGEEVKKYCEENNKNEVDVMQELVYKFCFNMHMDGSKVLTVLSNEMFIEMSK